MKLIVGLGNPGKEYINTRHNIGFMVLDNYLGKVDWKNKMEAQYYQTEMFGEQIIFIKPQTYMNLSGLAVSKYVNYFRININDLLIIQDDLDLPIGTCRIKRNSSSGGHNGLKSIINELKTEEFARLKIGIDKQKIIATDKYVLGKFSEKELLEINKNMNVYLDIINLWIKDGTETVMANYNN